MLLGFTNSRGTQSAGRASRGVRRRRLGFGLALAAVLGSLVVIPATGASALSIDCGYDSGLKYIYGVPGGRDGITCAGTSAAGAGGTITGGVPPIATRGGTSAPMMSPLCRYSPPALPAALFSRGPITIHDELRSASRGKTADFFERDGVPIAVREIGDPDRLNTGPTWIRIVDTTLFPAAVIYEFDCMSSGGWMISADKPTGSDIAPPVATPSPVPSSAHASMTPVPGRSNEFFYRLDMMNDSFSTNHSRAVLNLSAFTLTDVVSAPPGASCVTVTEQAAQCESLDLPAGSTSTFVLLVRARPTIDTTADLRAMAWTVAALHPHSIGFRVVDVMADVTPVRPTGGL